MHEISNFSIIILEVVTKNEQCIETIEHLLYILPYFCSSNVTIFVF